MTYNKDKFKVPYFYLIGIFYSGQGYSLGSLVLLFPIYMLNELDASSRSEAVTIAAIMVIPWYVKFLFGLITDNFSHAVHEEKALFVNCNNFISNRLVNRIFT